MLYFIPRSYDGLDPLHFGVIDRPHSDAPTRMIQQGYKWCGDNEAFTGKFNLVGKGPSQRANKYGWLDWLKMMLPYQSTCVLIACPDVIGDAIATTEQFHTYAPAIAALGYKPAYVAQDGAEILPLPDDAGAIFIGGSTDWKMGAGARDCIWRAQQRGLWVHIGRVNSHRRYHYFQSLGADSCDGTHIIFRPTSAVKAMKKWTAQTCLFDYQREDTP